MIIAVNAIFFQDDFLEGYGQYAVSIFERLVRSHPEHEFVFIYDRPHQKEWIMGPNVRSVTIAPAARHVPAFFIGTI